MMNLLLQLLACICIASLSASAFLCPTTVSSNNYYCQIQQRRTRTTIISSSQLNLVTEADVIALVEQAEALWTKVEQLRNEANDLSIQAETLGHETELSTEYATNLLKDNTISEGKIAEISIAQNNALDLGALLDRAQQATEEADESEVLADEALAASEVALAQHLIDFPEDDQIEVMG